MPRGASRHTTDHVDRPSIGEGYLVEYPHTIGARLGADLTSMCGAPVEVQNLAAKGYENHRLVSRMQEALTVRPDAVLFVVLPFDIYEQSERTKSRAAGVAPPNSQKIAVDGGLQARLAT